MQTQAIIICIVALATVSYANILPHLSLGQSVCGFNGENYKIFPSVYLMERENERSLVTEVYDVVPMNLCRGNFERSYEEEYTQNDTPVCGYNGQFYSQFHSLAKLQMVNKQIQGTGPAFQVAHMDFCQTERVDNLAVKLNLDFNTDKCLKACPSMLRPVCVSNGVYRGLIDNDCLLDVYNCLKAENVSPFYILREYQC